MDDVSRHRTARCITTGHDWYQARDGRGVARHRRRRASGCQESHRYLIWTSWQVFQVEKMYVGLLVIAVVGFASAILLNWLEKFVVPWKHV